MGKIYIVGLGPGDSGNMTYRALEALESSEVLVGYSAYVSQVEELFLDKEIVRKGMGQEIERCKIAIDKACEGKTVCVVCSGDSSLYGMAGLLLQMKQKDNIDIELEVVPGITSAISCASLLGAPIVEDFCTISLSDYMVPWEKILRRIEAAASTDFVIAIYNPKSKMRPDYLKVAIERISHYRSDATPIGIVKNAYRDDQRIIITTIRDIDYDTVDMFCTVIVGNSNTYIKDEKLITHRGYNI